MKRVLSGIQPSGELHLGNYFGAIKQHVEESKKADPVQKNALFFIADLHALTTVHNREQLRYSVKSVAATYISLGLDVEKAVFFRQSDVPEVSQLYWLLMSCTGMGLMERAHSFKDKVSKGLQVNLGLFTYPVLMAADILIYGSDLVPVGVDQVQHVEMAKDMATHFNVAYSTNCLKLPEASVAPVGKMPGIDGDKMSKSYGNTIPIFATGKHLRKLVSSIKTDSRPPEEPKNPDEVLIYQIMEPFLSTDEKSHYRSLLQNGKIGYGDLKGQLIEKIEATFSEARTKYDALIQNEKELDIILARGADAARKIARAKLAECFDAVGMESAARSMRI